MARRPVAAPPASSIIVPAAVPAAAPSAAHHARAASHRTRKVVHTAWPLAAIGALSILAGNPLKPTTAPPVPVVAASAASGTITDVSPGAYVAPDGRSFAQLVAAHVLPDPMSTPGVLNPAVTPETIRATVCTSGWTATVRPKVSITDKIKLETTPPGHQPSEFELDHLLSIEDGGAPDDTRNLWMQAYNDLYGARTKDVLETKMKTMVCKGQLTLAQAQAALAPNWLVGFEKYVGPLPTGD